MGQRVLALDLGSSSVRAIVFEADSAGGPTMVAGALARRPRHVRADEPGQATFDPDDYLADLVACIDELHAGGQLGGVSDVAMACQWHSLLAVDSAGHPLGDLLTWADTRPRRPDGAAAPGPRELEELRQRTGCAFASLYWTYRIPWLGAGQQHFAGLSEHVGLALLGDPSMSVSMASGTGLLGTAAMTWDDGALELAGTSPASLPVLAPEQWRGRLSGEWRRRWPPLSGAAWHPALGDGAAANLGAGCGTSARAVVTVGTSAAVRTLMAAPAGSHLPVLASGLWRYRASHDRVVNGAAYSSGGQLYAWALSLWEGAPRPAAPGGRAGAAPPARHDEVRYDVDIPVPAGSEGALVIPWHTGTRPPAVPVASNQGCVLGLGLGHTGAHIVSAAAEAVCFQLAGGLDDLEAGTGDRLDVLGNGGVLERSELWRSRLAAALGRPVRFSRAPETTARGAALAALGGARDGVLGTPGEQRSSLDGVDDELVKPAEADVVALARARLRWLGWYEALLPNARGAGG